MTARGIHSVRSSRPELGRLDMRVSTNRGNSPEPLGPLKRELGERLFRQVTNSSRAVIFFSLEIPFLVYLGKLSYTYEILRFIICTSISTINEY